jgi:hypothetical protein
MTIETDDVLKEALKKKIGGVIDEIPVSLESLEIVSTARAFKLTWRRAEEEYDE